MTDKSAISFCFCLSDLTWRSPTNGFLHPLTLKVRRLCARGLKERIRRRTVGPVTFHFSLTQDSRLEAPAPPSLRRARRASVLVVYVRTGSLTVHQLPRAPLQRSQAPITVGLVPSSSVLEVMWSALQGRHHRRTHISAEILPVPVSLHRNPG